ncbi:unnamed protein product [Polarella glacialis]|uniref:Thioredoxin domain-containing protein n=1 Tax=Polarella glacialis TaxID=89957 RepID=A0A813H2Y5_POLGL|nr:unnamed protein product [Polarella glacialis]
MATGRGSGLLALVAASLIGSVYAEKDNIVKLTKFNFDSNVKQGSWFVKFYAPWCTHCQRMAPIWEKLADLSVSREWPVKISEVDCTVSKDVCDKAQIKAFPTLALVSDGMLKGKYHGDASVASFEAWLKSQGVLEEGGGAPAPGAPSGGGERLTTEEARQQATATHGVALKALLYNMMVRFPTESSIINMYFYFGCSMCLLVVTCCFLGSLVGVEEEDHDKDR